MSQSLAATRWEQIVAPDEPLILPDAWTAPPKPPLPVVAAIVPVLGAVGLWLFTGSILSLWLALLGPVIAVAARLDASRATRRDKRRAVTQWDAEFTRVTAEVGRRHDAERAKRWLRHPDVAGFVAREQEIWRTVPGRTEALVAAAGAVPSGLQVSGGGADRRAVAARADAAVLGRAPIAIPSAGVVCVAGPAAAALAVKRALALQLCLALPPGELRLVGALAPEDAWAEALPHRRATTGLTLALCAAGALVPPEAEVALVRAEPGARLPGCAAILEVTSPSRTRLDHDGVVRDVEVEAVGEAQARAIAVDLAERADALPGAAPRLSGPVALSGLLAAAPRAAGGLAAVVGVDGGTPVTLDLVADGPHAVVAGVTGSGKSELLVTWVLALAASRTTQEVSFLLADFKGGTAFDALTDLPHVTGVLTDLDGAGARRAIESLRAEVRWREGELARVGARDVRDPRVEIPRLVIVVDEFAALLGDHPELHAVFTDVAARGRALGMHLILGTQRVAGVVRDALLANCPLRVSLRVTDAADSRAVIGTDDAARLTGGPAGAGLAFVRGPSDSAPRRLTVALSSASDIAQISASSAGPKPRRPWLPDLPDRIPLAELRAGAGDGMLVLGLADEPERQRQIPVELQIADRGVLVVGRAGSGRSTTLGVLAAQARRVVAVPSDAERAWDCLTDLVDSPPSAGTVVLLDDADALVARFPQDYAVEVVERIERVIRGAGDHGYLAVATAQRLTGSMGRALELLPRRVLLAAASRAEHIALGGDGSHHSSDQGPGRARVDGRAVQIAIPPTSDPVAAAPAPAGPWFPDATVTGFVARRSAGVRAVLQSWEDAGIRVVPVGEMAQGAPDEGRVVLAGDPEEWQRHWQVLSAVRGEHDLVVDASCASEFRALAADRAMPPYCAPGRGRAWLCRAGAPAERVVLLSQAHRNRDGGVR